MLKKKEMYTFIIGSLALLFGSVFLDEYLLPAEPIGILPVYALSFIPIIVLASFFLIGSIFLKKSKRTGALLVLMLSIILFTAHILKILFERDRPTITLADFSFPSAHSALVFSLLPFAFYVSRKMGYYYTAYAFLVGLSRVALKQHYFSDVVAGGLFGFSIAWVFLAVLQASEEKDHGLFEPGPEPEHRMRSAGGKGKNPLYISGSQKKAKV